MCSGCVLDPQPAGGGLIKSTTGPPLDDGTIWSRCKLTTMLHLYNTSLAAGLVAGMTLGTPEAIRHVSDGRHPTATSQVWDPSGAIGRALWIGYRCCCFFF